GAIAISGSVLFRIAAKTVLEVRGPRHGYRVGDRRVLRCTRGTDRQRRTLPITRVDFLRRAGGEDHRGRQEQYRADGRKGAQERNKRAAASPVQVAFSKGGDPWAHDYSRALRVTL